MRNDRYHIFACLFVGGLLVILAGCDEGVSRNEPTQQTVAEPESKPQSDFSGSGSTYGKARDTAVGIVEKQEQRQKELSDLATNGGEEPE